MRNNGRRILLVDLGVSFGGIEVYICALTKLIRERAVITLLCMNPELAARMCAEGVRVITFPSALHLGKLIQILISVAILPYICLRYRIRTIWIQGYTEIVLLPFARLMGCRAFATRHLSLDKPEAGWHLHPRRKVSRVLYRYLAFTSHKIICVSETVAAGMRSVVNPAKITAICNWVDGLPESTQRHETSPNSLHLLFVGRLQRYKGVSLVLEAMRKAMKDNPTRNLQLTVVGEGDCRAELEQQARGLEVHFVGFQRDPRPFFRDCDAFINPSVGPEGLPLVSIEAMSHGIPCILSDITIHNEITENGDSALLFRTGDSADLCAKIVTLLSSPRLRQEYGSKAREAIKRRYTAEIARRRYVAELCL